jgi:heme exporter protein A
MTAQLCIDQLVFERSDQPVFQQINVALQPGELLQIQGPNGSGKSTLLRIIAGFIEPQLGTIAWQNKSIFQTLDIYQRQLHYLGHHNGIKHTLTVQENLQLQCALSGQKIDLCGLKNILKKIGLIQLLHTPAYYLSAGQRRRLSLARLLLNPLPLWILDEPTTALDTAGQNLLTDLLSQHLNNNRLAIIATHHPWPFTRNIKTLELGMHHA